MTITEKTDKLVGLINGSEAIHDDDRGYWLRILPDLLESQIDRFIEILEEEKQAFADIPGKIMQDLQNVVWAALAFNSGIELNEPVQISYNMLPPVENDDDDDDEEDHDD